MKHDIVLHASTTASSSSAMLELVRRACRVVTSRDVTLQVEFGLIKAELGQYFVQTHIQKNVKVKMGGLNHPNPSFLGTPLGVACLVPARKSRLKRHKKRSIIAGMLPNSIRIHV